LPLATLEHLTGCAFTVVAQLHAQKKHLLSVKF